MQRVPEVLELPVVIQGRRPLALEPQPLEKLDFLLGRRAAEGSILKESVESRLFDEKLVGLLARGHLAFMQSFSRRFERFRGRQPLRHLAPLHLLSGLR
jgi:hypothetical protein